MSMIPCPGCGLPRVEEQVATVPCPVCATAGADAGPARAGAKKPAGPDPTAGLPTDVGELGRFAGHTGGGFPGWFVGATLFACGIAAGVAGVLGWQTAFPPEPPRDSPAEVAWVNPSPPTPPRRVAVAPMPHEYVPPPPIPGLTPGPGPGPESPPPDPKSVVEPPPPGRVVTVELNQPDATYTVPFPMKKGERVVLKGKVNTLKVSGLDGGAVLDASGLEASNVHVSGKIDNRSELKVNAPSGTVTVSGSVGGNSFVVISAPGGDVKFSNATKDETHPGSRIDGGSRVVVTARAVELKGDVNGIETRVTVNLPRSGWLRVAAVRGIATVEYSVADGKGTPDVSVGHVSPTANFKRITID